MSVVVNITSYIFTCTESTPYLKVDCSNTSPAEENKIPILTPFTLSYRVEKNTYK